MSQHSNTKNSPFLIGILALFVVVKLVWVLVEYLYLPEEGIEKIAQKAKSSLHYRYRFASDVALPKAKAPVKARPVKRQPSIKDIRLVGIYSSDESAIVTLLKKGKSYILSKGEEIDGFVLTGASAREAYFEKQGKKYILKLFEKKIKGKSHITEAAPVSQENDQENQEQITSHDGIRVVPRNMLRDYVSDMDKAMRDIGLRPVKRNDQMIGYKVRFIRKNSPLEKLGLLRGDVIKAINGEDIVDFNGPMDILKSADTIEGLTITVIRKNEEKELEYEVQ